MMKKVYPVILSPSDIGYFVTVPDLDINTQGQTLADAIDMARDAIGLWGISEEDDGRAIPEPSIQEPHHTKGDTITWVDIDFARYRLLSDATTVRMNVTLPRYLKTLGEEANINFSQELQERLKERLHYSN